ncbi:helix-turn-helix domain-containing protein [Nonomuraea sp. NPDC050536]|uniref:helix-turn-helix domain-containing protein n=1 Tax=Nonomuraea sp. NPDC050536 TaxID=3364366 RepID=UPI0037CB3444
MDSAELLQRVRELRGQGRSPKQIARELGVSPSAVAPLVRAIAAEAPSGPGEIVGAWVSDGWSVGLTVDPSRGWTDAEPSPQGAGLVSVLAARRHGWDKVSVAGFLVDVYCLGVKNTIGPDVMDELELRRFRDYFFSDYPGWQEAPVELARNLVFGSEEYAGDLGFETLESFAAVAEHLGPWEGPAAITFGRDGKPYYVAGPNDESRKVLRILEHSVGAPPNYDYQR